jgi:hypothetical protein
MNKLEPRVYVTEELVEKGFQRILDGGDQVALAATLERRGGPCPLCQREFKKIEVDNQFGRFDYFQPSCRCYHICQEVHIPTGATTKGCGRFMIAEREFGITHCLSCYDTAWEKAGAAQPYKTNTRKFNE